MAVVIAIVVSVAYMFLWPSSSQGRSLDGSKEEHIFERSREEFLVKLTFGDKSREGLIELDEDHSLVFINDVAAGLSVTLDYDGGIVMIKNSSSSECLFTLLEHFPEYQRDDIKTINLILEQEVGNVFFPLDSGDADTLTLHKPNFIPQGYVQLASNPKIAEQCVDSASYWLEGRRQKRKSADDFATWLPVTSPKGRKRRYAEDPIVMELKGEPPGRIQRRKMADDFVTWLPGTTPMGRKRREVADHSVIGLEGEPPVHSQRRKLADDFVVWLPVTSPKSRKRRDTPTPSGMELKEQLPIDNQRRKTPEDFVTWLPGTTPIGRKRRETADHSVIGLEEEPRSRSQRRKLSEDFSTWFPGTPPWGRKRRETTDHSFPS